MLGSLLLGVVLAAALPGDEYCKNPEEVLEGVIASFEKSANAERDAGKSAPEPKEELDLDAEVLSDAEELVNVKGVSKQRLLDAGYRYAREHVLAGDNKDAARVYRALLAMRMNAHAEPKTVHETRFMLTDAMAKSGEREAAIKLLEKNLEQGVAVLPTVQAIFRARYVDAAPEPAFDWFAAAITDKRYGFTKPEQTLLWNYFGYYAFYSMRREQMERVIAISKARGIPLEGHADMCNGAVKKFDELKTFPKKESEIRFPQTLKDFGFDPDAKVVHVKDYGWDDEDATECIYAALNTDATTLIFDNMGTPWRVSGIKISAKQGSKRQFVFAKGVKIYAKDDKASWMKDVFSLDRVQNSVWIGDDGVEFGHFADLESRRKVRTEGASCIGMGGVKNIAMRKIGFVNSCCDGLIIGGGENLYFEDIDMNGNFRQGASFGPTQDVHFRRCKFHNTGPGAPGSGIDFEPSYEVWPNNNFYFFDCLFDHNSGDGITYATSTYLPVTGYYKRCTIASTATALLIKARPGIYWQNNMPAPSCIVFEDCNFLGSSDVDPIRFQSTSLFNVTFRNCTLKDRGPYYPNHAHNAPAFMYLLDRDLWKGPCALDGLVTFENFTVEGYTNAPLFAVSRGKNVTYQPTRFKGEVIHNGKPFKVEGMSIPDRK